MIRIDQLKKTYDRRSKHARSVLHGLSFTLPDTGFVCILGASGCGKTTLLNAIGGLDAFDSGCITTDSAEIKRQNSRIMELERNANFGYIFQNYYLLSEHSVAYNVYLGMHSLPLSKQEKLRRVREALKKVDMLRYRKRAVGQLSGGQQQRVAIARAIAREPKVIFADEPTGNLDEANTVNICSILKELSQNSLVVMVTHEERIASCFADRIITLSDGSILSDTTEWSRSAIEAGEKDALYTADYAEECMLGEQISLRLLHAEDAAPVKITVVAERDRIVIKTDDSRIVLSSEQNAPPKLIEGERPVLSFNLHSPEKMHAEKEQCDAKKRKRNTGNAKLGFLFLWKEAKFLVSGKKRNKFATAVFIILLSLMLSMTISDIITTAYIDPEDFVTTDSHTLSLRFNRGEAVSDTVWSLDEFKKLYMKHLDASGLDFDYMLSTNTEFEYIDTALPQIGQLSLALQGASYVHISRLDQNDLIYGRMPERFDEIVVDRWIIDKALAEEGIVQNVIPNSKYLLGKTLKASKKGFSPTIVGICDSGEPDIYMGTEALLSIGSGGMEAVSLSEFRELTGYEGVSALADDECIVLSDMAGNIYLQLIGKTYTLSKGRTFRIADTVAGTLDLGISVKMVVPDEKIAPAYREMIEELAGVTLWCEDKEAMQAYIANGLPPELTGMLDIDVYDNYKTAYDAYRTQTMSKTDAKTIVTWAIIALSVIMLYLMQRAKINERMDLIAVYRLLGVPKKNLMTVFAIEAAISTLKYAVPTVLFSWIVIGILGRIEEIGLDMIFPLWAAGSMVCMILLLRVMIAVLPVFRLLRKPPARLAAKYDF